MALIGVLSACTCCALPPLVLVAILVNINVCRRHVPSYPHISIRANGLFYVDIKGMYMYFISALQLFTCMGFAFFISLSPVLLAYAHLCLAQV